MSALLGLPRELRDTIFDLTFHDVCFSPSREEEGRHYGTLWLSGLPTKALFLVNKQIYEEYRQRASYIRKKASWDLKMEVFMTLDRRGWSCSSTLIDWTPLDHVGARLPFENLRTWRLHFFFVASRDAIRDYEMEYVATRFVQVLVNNIPNPPPTTEHRIVVLTLGIHLRQVSAGEELSYCNFDRQNPSLDKMDSETTSVTTVR